MWIRKKGLSLPIVLLSLAGCGGDGLCSIEALQSALDGAAAGDTVRMGACRVEGTLTVPMGVELAGAGAERSILVVPESMVGLRLFAGEGSRLAGVGVESSGTVAVLGRGGGPLVVEDVTVTAERGIGMAFDGADAVTLRNVTATGPIRAEGSRDPLFVRVRSRLDRLEGETCDMPGTECTDGERRDVMCGTCARAFTQSCVCGVWQTVVATHGLAFLGVGDARLEDVTVQGFAQVGVTVTDTDARGAVVPGAAFAWTRTGAIENMGTGLTVQGGVVATLADLDLSATLGGPSGSPPYAGFFIGDPALPVEVRSTDLSVLGNERFGLVHFRARGSHERFTAEGNGHAALWLGEVDGLEIRNAMMMGNEFAGIVAIDSANVTVSGTTVADTALQTLAVGIFGLIRVGDGIHLKNSLSGIVLEDVALRGNDRAGILIDLAGTRGEDITFRNVMVDGSGAELGAVAGDGADTMSTISPLADWEDDGGIMRLGATAANDVAAAGTTIQRNENPLPQGPLARVIIITPCD